MNIDKAKNLNTGKNGMDLTDARQSLEAANGDSIYSMLLAFNLGFMRGQRAEKVRAGKKAVKA